MQIDKIASAGRDTSAALVGLPLWRLAKVRAFVDAHLDTPLRLADLASAAGLSRMHFAARFRAATGMRPHDYVLSRRIAFAKDQMMLANGAMVHIALDAGFQSQAHFCTVFKRLNAVTPTAWQRQALAACAAHRAEPAQPVLTRSPRPAFAGFAPYARDAALSRDAYAA